MKTAVVRDLSRASIELAHPGMQSFKLCVYEVSKAFVYEVSW